VTRSPSKPPAAPDAEPIAPAAPRRRGRKPRPLQVTGRFDVPAAIESWERELLLPLVTQILGDIERERHE